MSGDIARMKSWQQQKECIVGFGATLSMRTSMYFLSSLLASRSVPGTINGLPKPYQLAALRASNWWEWLSICLYFSPLATVLFPFYHLNPFLSCPILFICFSSKLSHLFRFELQMLHMFHPSQKILKSSQVCNSVALIPTEALTPRNRPPPL